MYDVSRDYCFHMPSSVTQKGRQAECDDKNRAELSSFVRLMGKKWIWVFCWMGCGVITLNELRGLIRWSDDVMGMRAGGSEIKLI